MIVDSCKSDCHPDGASTHGVAEIFRIDMARDYHPINARADAVTRRACRGVICQRCGKHFVRSSLMPERCYRQQSPDKRITIIPLTVGYYRVSAENLRDVPELSGIAVNFKLIKHHRK